MRQKLPQFAISKINRHAAIVALCCFFSFADRTQWVEKNTEVTGTDVLSFTVNASGPTIDDVKDPPLTGNQPPLLTQPTLQTSNLVIDEIGTTTVSFDVTAGNGTHQMIVMKEGPNIDGLPVDGTAYTGTFEYGTGSEIGDGNFVIAVGGSGWSWIVNGLEPETQYTIMSFALNDNSSGNFTTEEANFLTTTATGNPVSFYTLANEPSAQPANLTFSDLDSDSFSGHFDAASPAANGYLVLMCENPPDIIPEDGVTYTLNQQLGTTGGEIVYAAYSGGSTTFPIGNISNPETQLHFKIYAYNGSGSSINYRQDLPLAGSQKTLAAEPLTQTTSIVVNAITDNSITLNFSNGNGNSRIVVARESGTAAIDPADGVSYSANTTFGSGSQTGTGNYVVHTGSGPVTVTNLTPGTSYIFQVYEFSGSGGSENYLTTTATNNPLTIRKSWHVLSGTGGSDLNNGSAGAPFATIGKALNSAQAGDIIKVAAGVYQQGLITQSKVVLRGGYPSTFIEADRDIFAYKTTVFASSTILLNDTHGCMIDGFVFDGNNSVDTGLRISSSSIVTHNVILRCRGTFGKGIDLLGSAYIANNTLHDNRSGIVIFGTAAASATFKNNIVTKNIWGIQNSEANEVRSYNDVYDNSFDYTGSAGFDVPGTGDISQDPLYFNTSGDDFRLKGPSPAINAGDPSDPVGDEPAPAGLIDMGAYGGTKNATIPIPQPDDQTTDLSLSATSTTVTVSFQPGGGTSRLLVCRAGGDINSHPVDGTNYVPNSAISSAPMIDFGNYVVGLRTGLDTSPVTVTGLNPSTNYYFRMYEFNGSAGSENYLTSAAPPNNPKSIQTTAIASEPGQATSLTFSNITTTSITVGYSVGTGSGRLLVAREGGAVNADPQAGTPYTANNQFGNGDEIGTGNFVVGISSTTSTSAITVTGLTPNTLYHFRMYEFNGSGGTENYNTIPTLDNPRSQATSDVVIEPTAQPTSLQFSNVTATTISGSFTPATGTLTGYLVVMGTGAASDTPPSDGATYSLNQSLGTNGKVITAGNSTTFNLTALTAETTYYFKIYAYNGSGSNNNYRTTDPLQGSKATEGFASQPANPPSNFNFMNEQAGSIDISWQKGTDATNTLVIARLGSATNQQPVDGVSYSANATFSVGDNLGNNNYVIYNGAGNNMTLSGLTGESIYHFAAFSFNGSPGYENYNLLAATPTFTKIIVDTSPPTVAHTTSATVAFQQNLTISANITDDQSPITSATIQFRSISGGGTLTPRSLTASGSSYSAEILASVIGELGIEYKISATAGGTYNDEFFKTIKVTMPAGSSLPIPYSSFGSSVSNYRIVAVPLELDSKSVGSVFNELAPADPKKWRIYHYENGSNKELNTNSLIETGKGYWLIVKENPGEAIVAGSGSTVQTSSDDPYSINLTAGWNQIGNPYNFKLSWDDMQTANSGLPDIIRTYDGNFADDDRLDIMEGGFVNVTTARTIVFPVVKNTSLGRKKDVKKQWQNPIDQNNWQVYITLSQGERSNRISGFGMHENASESRDEFDGLTMPRFFGEHLEVNHHKRSGNDHFSKDIVPTSENYTWEFDIDTNLESKVMTFSWDNSYFGDNEKSLVLWNAAQQIGIDMRTSNSYTFEKDKSRAFRVFFGSAEEVKDRSMASRFVFHSASPNPADGDVVISFSVPKDADQNMVEAEIYDLMGRKTWHHQAQFGAGYQQLVWHIDGQDAPGVYIIQLKQGSATEQKRIIIKSN